MPEKQNRKQAYFSPVWPEKLTMFRVKHSKVIFTDIGREIMCPRCKEYWPADNEFFYSQPSATGGISSWCKCCYLEWKNEKYG
jgi:hypothetical protein